MIRVKVECARCGRRVRVREGSEQERRLMDGEPCSSCRPTGATRKATDAEVTSEAARDRAQDLGRYGITPAQREELRRMERPRRPGGPVQQGSMQLWDED